MQIMNIKKILFLIILASPLLWGQSGNYKFRHYTINEGLSESMVSAVLQDHKGFIWFGSNGLSKFDGYKFTNYFNHADDPNSLINNYTQVLFEDSKKRLWIGTRTGISIYSRETNNFSNIFPDSLNGQLNVASLAEDKNGIIYIGTYGYGLFLFNPATQKISNFRFNEKDGASISSDWLSSIVISERGEVWVSTYHGLNLFNPSTGKFTRFKRVPYNSPEWTRDVITSLRPDKWGNLWVGTRFGISKFDPIARKFTDLLIPSSFRKKDANLYITSLVFVSENELWAGSHDGIYILNTVTGSHTQIQHRENDFESLASNEIEALYLDNASNLWVATRAKGVDKLKFVTERFIHFKNTNPGFKKMSNNEIYGITEDVNNNIWFATLSGLNKFNPSSNQVQSFLKKDDPGITSDIQWTVYTNKKIMNDLAWAGTDAGVFAFSISSGKTVSPFRNKKLLDTLKFDRIMAITIDSKKNMWLGSEAGLIRINLETEEIKRFRHSTRNPKSISSDLVWRLFIDSKKNLWVCTTNGLNRLSPGSEEFISYKNRKGDPHSISNNEICSIYEDKSGAFWVGTSDGLNKLDPSTGKFERIKLEIPAETIYSIEMDKSGNLWLGTGKGLIKHTPSTGRTIIYDVEDGLQSNEFNFPSLVSSSGKFYFTGVNGFNVFDPEKVFVNKHVPPVYITGFSLMNRQINPGDKFNGRVLFTSPVEDVKEIVLNFDENIISLEFSALDFLSPEKNKYKYIMENFESGWNDAGNRRFVTYKLDPGTYYFRVKGSNSDDVWNEEGAVLKIDIRPPWWNTLWFKLLALTAGMGLLLLFFKTRTRNLEKQKSNLEKIVKERTYELEKQQAIVKEQAERIQLTNLELEQLNMELEKRVIERTAELEKAKIKAEKADEIKSEFLAQMSHEIRSPINVVLSFSSLIKSELEDKIDPDLKEGFKSISNAGKRIIRTVDLLLNMSEIQTQTYEYIPEPLDIENDILNQLLPEYLLSAKEKSLSIDFKNHALNRSVIGDNYTLEQIFANLIDNAIKYTNSGGISISLGNDDTGKLTCSITDTGIGMGEDFFPRLFVPFSQEEQGYTRKYEGNGLGLALVKKYCDLNSIEINVASKKGRGTTFTLKFNNTIMPNSE